MMFVYAVVKSQFLLTLTKPKRQQNMTPNDITAGETWAAKFRTTRMLGTDGKPVVNLKVGETAQGPGNWESVGIIVKRDTASSKLELVDVFDQTRHVVDYGDVWDIDRAEIVEDA
jgi:hypothetical protein|tara:strand:- start:946 stop:1290 length:345 start_codon:yes stop_codon:yes gene_type:complete